jgi:Putative redox-active protein (C_GCAxxG_C_C)
MDMAKYFFSGKFLSCFNLAEAWRPEAIDVANEGLCQEYEDLPEHPISCASEVVKKMGGSVEEMIMVAGFAGGLGLCGNACGALSAAIWKKTLAYCKVNKKTTYTNTDAEEILEKFYSVTDYEITCEKILGRRFQSVEDHTEFVKNGGCGKLIDTLAQL